MNGWSGLGIVLVLFGINLNLYVLINVNKTIAEKLEEIKDSIQNMNVELAEGINDD